MWQIFQKLLSRYLLLLELSRIASLISSSFCLSNRPFTSFQSFMFCSFFLLLTVGSLGVWCIWAPMKSTQIFNGIVSLTSRSKNLVNKSLEKMMFHLTKSLKNLSCVGFLWIYNKISIKDLSLKIGLTLFSRSIRSICSSVRCSAIEIWHDARTIDDRHIGQAQGCLLILTHFLKHFLWNKCLLLQTATTSESFFW